MLLYHPFFDPHHCAFRLLRLLLALKGRPIEVDRLRVWDFYLLFPRALDHASLPRSHAAKIRSLLKRRYASQYEMLPDLRIMFLRLEPIQSSALAHIASRNIVEPSAYQSNMVILANQGLSSDLVSRLQASNDADAELVGFLINAFLEVPLFGKDGIRQRSDLFDCRYDPI